VLRRGIDPPVDRILSPYISQEAPVEKWPKGLSIEVSPPISIGPKSFSGFLSALEFGEEPVEEVQLLVDFIVDGRTLAGCKLDRPS
jgi:hypothetical protein